MSLEMKQLSSTFKTQVWQRPLGDELSLSLRGVDALLQKKRCTRNETPHGTFRSYLTRPV